jgi:hypothetical protein
VKKFFAFRFGSGQTLGDYFSDALGLGLSFGAGLVGPVCGIGCDPLGSGNDIGEVTSATVRGMTLTGASAARPVFVAAGERLGKSSAEGEAVVDVVGAGARDHGRDPGKVHDPGGRCRRRGRELGLGLGLGERHFLIWFTETNRPIRRGGDGKMWGVKLLL